MAHDVAPAPPGRPRRTRRPVAPYPADDATALVLHADPARVRIDPAAWWCDADVVERVYRRCRDAAPGPLAPDLAAAAEQAVALHRGELLESWDQDWCVRERDRWHL